MPFSIQILRIHRGRFGTLTNLLKLTDERYLAIGLPEVAQIEL